MQPGMIWSGPFDGETHHYFNSKFWTKNVNRHRCHWDEVDSHLQKMLQKFKPQGGSFVITPWNHVIALIEPTPLPISIEEQWKKLTKEQRRLIQIKQKSVQMLPVYICKLDEGFAIKLNEPLDYSKPLSKNELGEMLDFLSQFSTSETMTIPEKEDEIDDDVEEDWSDDEDFFEDTALDYMYTPSEME